MATKQKAKPDAAFTGFDAAELVALVRESAILLERQRGEMTIDELAAECGLRRHAMSSTAQMLIDRGEMDKRQGRLANGRRVYFYKRVKP
jgi:predicted transcriptional regulator